MNKMQRKIAKETRKQWNLNYDKVENKYKDIIFSKKCNVPNFNQVTTMGMNYIYDMGNIPTFKELRKTIRKELGWGKGIAKKVKLTNKHLTKRQWNIVEKILLEQRDKDKYKISISCNDIWLNAQKILKKKYGIIWYSPADLEPGALFD